MTNVKLAVIYYSSGGTNYRLAQWAEEGARAAGAEVRLLKVPETAPQEAIESNPVWKEHSMEAACIPEVTLGSFRMGRCHHFQCTDSIW